jgi:hypothetical protein
MKFTTVVASGVVLLSTLGPRLAQSEENIYILRGSDISCLQKNSEALVSLGEKRRLVSISQCPDFSSDPGMSTIVADGPSLVLRDMPFDQIIFIGSSEVQCLLSFEGVAETALYKVDFNECLIGATK